MNIAFRFFFALAVAFFLVNVPVGAQEVAPLFPCSSVLENAYGMCSHITRPYMDFNCRSQDLDCARRAGAKWIRSDFDFSTVFPHGVPEADNTVFDAVMQSCDSAGASLLPIIVGGTDKGWAWEDADDYMAYVEHVAQRYKGRIGHWEVINELNLQRRFPPYQLARNYASALKRVSQIIRRTDSQARVVFGGMGGVDSIFLTSVCGDGVTPESFDVMNFHSYNAPEELPVSFHRLAAIMRSQQWKKPVWLTETGFSTPPGIGSHKGFWHELVPYACRRLEINPAKSNIAVVSDPAHGVIFTTGQNDGYFDVFRKVSYIKCDEIAALDPKKTQFLLAAYGEYFPKEFNAAVVSYVRRGGTLVCPNGVPFYYNAWTTEGYVSSPSNVHSDLHIAFAYWWNDDAKRRNLPEIPSWRACAPGMELTYGWDFSAGNSARYLDTGNLREGDEFFPLLLAGTEQHNAPVAGVYRFGSDLKGNVIIQTRIDSPVRNENVQAQWVARAHIISFAYGMDKVFWYHLRAFEQNPDDWESYYGIVHKDFSPKPAFHAYETLVRMLPDGSTRPVLRIDGMEYSASWVRPDKRRVKALWSLAPGIKCSVKSRKSELYDYMGRPMKKRTFELGAGVVYVVEP